jgi:Na+/proline symporter
MNTVAACFLIPIGVSIYVMTGGMRATLVADYTQCSSSHIFLGDPMIGETAYVVRAKAIRMQYNTSV